MTIAIYEIFQPYNLKMHLFFEKNITFFVGENGTGKSTTTFVIYADGTNQILKLPQFENFDGNDEFLFYSAVSEDTVGCVDARTGESWLLEIKNNGIDYNHNIHNIETDGEYIYTCGPAGGQTTLWKLVYDETGKPVVMSLIDDDIKGNKVTH